MCAKANIEAWKDKKFGLFIHWGLYSLLGQGEWAMFRKPVDKDTYRLLMDRFTAKACDARQWTEAAQSAGMKYMVFTTRHHDGFALFDSAASFEGFTSMRAAAGRDFVAEYVAACKGAGLGVGLYYSPLDWRMPGFFLPRMYQKSAEQLVAQCHGQVRELLSNYGKIDVLWYDGGEDFWLCHGMNLHAENPQSTDHSRDAQVENFWRSDELDRMARELQPGIVINNRTGMRQYGDFLTPECRVGEFNTETPWETCDTLTGTWGWVPDAQMKSLRECIHLLVQVVTGGGNLLLNVGPKPDGSIEDRQLARLREIGDWLARYGESVYGTRGGPIVNGAWGGATWKENKLYIHILDWKQDVVNVPVPHVGIRNAYSLTSPDGTVRVQNGFAELSVPANEKQAIDSIFVLVFDQTVDAAYEGLETRSVGEKAIVSDALIV